jgi:hypothetical protein
MNPQTLRIRRATVDDRAALKSLWASMRLPADELEKSLTEFQVVENSDGEVVGAIGIQFSSQHTLLHSEGFQPPTAEVLARLPAVWKNEFDGGWLTLQLKNEEVIAAALEKEFAPFMAGEKSETKKISEKAKTINTVITVVGFAIGIISIGFAIYLFVHRNPFGK